MKWLKFQIETIEPRNVKLSYLILVLLWMAVQIIAFVKFGIRTPVDTEVYVELSGQILNGHWPLGSDFFYSGYACVLSLINLAGGKPTDIVILQVVASAVASVSIYSITRNITQYHFTSLIATFLYIGWIEIHQWNMIVYTDALFTSFVIISTICLYFSSRPVHYFLTAIIFLFTILIRPTGLIYLASTLCYFLFDFVKSNKYSLNLKVISTTLIFILFCVMLNVPLTYSVNSFFESYSKAEVIYPGIPFLINKPDQLFIPGENYPAAIRFVLFILANPFFFIKISAVKGILFLAHIKPYYSIWHNVAIAMALYPIYYFAVKGLRFGFSGSLKAMMIAFIFLQILTVSFTSENWDGRFLLPVLPYMFIFSAMGSMSFLREKTKAKK